MASTGMDQEKRTGSLVRLHKSHLLKVRHDREWRRMCL